MEQLVLTTNQKNQKNKKLTKFQVYTFYFLLFSFCGWCLETIYSYVVLGHFTNRGFFYGPICPIYGVGGIILLIFLDELKSTPVHFFIYSIIILSIFEYTAGFGVDALYGISLWDYNDEFLNINGRICLFYSIAWGIMALLFRYLIFPLFKKIEGFISSKLPFPIKIITIYLFSAIFIMDSLYSFIEYSHIQF